MRCDADAEKNVAGAAEHVVDLAERRFDGIERDGTDDENGHAACAGVWR